MKRSTLASLAASAVLGLSAHGTYAATWFQQGSGGFGSFTLPAGVTNYFPDVFNGATTYYYNTHGRVISNAEVTSNFTGATLTQINPTIWSGTGASMFEFQITNPSTFTAYINNSTATLALFNSNGGALAAATGGSSDVITGSSIPGLTAGEYYIAEGTSPGQPYNAEGNAIFNLTSPGVVFPTASDVVLSGNEFQAWGLSNTTTAGGPYLIGPSTFTQGQSSIYLAGANYAVVPEPASLGLLGVMSLGLLARRRKVAR